MNADPRAFQASETQTTTPSHLRNTDDKVFNPPAFVPPGAREIKHRRILVPVDFSGFAVLALECATALSLAMDATVTLFHVVRVDLVHNPLDQAPERINKKCTIMFAQLQNLASLFGSDQQRIEVAVAIGEPYVEIIRQARDLEADLIIMTAKKYGGLLRLLHRDTTLRVLRAAQCPVMITRLFEHDARWRSGFHNRRLTSPAENLLPQ